MSLNYEELDFRKTPLGDLMLRRRRMFEFPGLDIHEVEPGEDFLMSSLFHEAESKLSKLGLGSLDGETLEVVGGGLGLGYTAAAALDDQRVTLLIVVDIDLARTNVLHQTNRRFYSEVGLVEVAQHLRPGGVFGLWADGLPDGAFADLLGKVFATVRSNTVEFDNPLTGRQSAGTVYVARTLMVLGAKAETEPRSITLSLIRRRSAAPPSSPGKRRRASRGRPTRHGWWGDHGVGRQG